MDPITEMFELAYAEGASNAFADFAEEYEESTFEEQYENEQFAQDGEFENMGASDMM